ncbi:hypothetical protein DSECCO2_439360 [anaerobic digester metagenome]
MVNSPVLIRVQERLDALLTRRRTPSPVLAPPDEQALARHYRAYLESPSGLRQVYYDGTQTPRAHLDYFDGLRDRLYRTGVSIIDRPIELDAFRAWMEHFPVIDRFYRRFGDIWIEKCLEHYLVSRELGLVPGDTYIDVASAGSPWARTLRHQGVSAYRLDLIYRPGVHGINIGGDATGSGLPDEFARALSIQCAFELFYGRNDIGFMEETARVLCAGGRAAVTPLYLDDAHFVLHSPRALPPPGSEEPDAVRVWRDDGVSAPFSRHYSPESFAARIAAHLPGPLRGRVVYVPNLEEVMETYPDQRIYGFFTFVIDRPGTPISS